MKSKSSLRPLTRIGIILSVMSIIGTVLSTEDMLRFTRNELELALAMYIRVGIAELAVMASFALLIACAHVLKDDRAVILERLRVVCFVGFASELLYQGYDFFFLEMVVSSLEPMSWTINQKIARAMLDLKQLSMGWMVFKLSLYAALFVSCHARITKGSVFSRAR